MTSFRGGDQGNGGRASRAGSELRRRASAWYSAEPVVEPALGVAPPEPLPAPLSLGARAAAWFTRATPAAPAEAPAKGPAAPGLDPPGEVTRNHLKGVLEALIFAAEQPLQPRELAKLAQAEPRLVRTLLTELVADYRLRGFRLEEIGGGYAFRTSPAFAPFVREQVAKRPVKMSRAQLETLAIVAYRQPVTRPEIDDIRGVDSGGALKSLLERELIRILGKKEEPGRPMLYGTTATFLSFFGLKALGELPTLREFTELSEESMRVVERELGDDAAAPTPAPDAGLMGGEGSLHTVVTSPDAGPDETPVAG